MWDEEQERDAQEKVNKNSQNKVNSELQGKYQLLGQCYLNQFFWKFTPCCHSLSYRNLNGSLKSIIFPEKNPASMVNS